MSNVDRILNWLKETNQNPDAKFIHFKHDPWCTFFQPEKICTCTPEVWVDDKRVDWEREVTLKD